MSDCLLFPFGKLVTNLAFNITLFRSIVSNSSSMGEVGEGKSMSYAAIVSPGGGGGAAPGPAVGGQPEAAVEAKEVVTEEAHHPIDDDLEGFQEVEIALKF